MTVEDQDVYDALTAEDLRIPVDVVRAERMQANAKAKEQMDAYHARFVAKKAELESLEVSE